MSEWQANQTGSVLALSVPVLNVLVRFSWNFVEDHVSKVR